MAQGEPSFLLEAHNAISARIVQKAKFDAVWASGLTLSSTLGRRDANEATWTELADVASSINDAIDIPVLLDGDNGHGSFNSVRQLVKRTSAAGIAGVVLEDKQFPKLNSFLETGDVLLDAKQFCGFIRAAKDSQRDADYSVIARTETLVIGRSMNEALDRAASYCEAGADAIVIHSKASDGNEVIQFLLAWKNRSPTVVIPTKYFSTPSSDLLVAGARTIIWANHLLRASIRAMEHAAHEIARTRSVAGIEPDIATLHELFELMDYDELFRAAATYGAASPAN
jgi:phosphoenolpyruvate phosphomutase